MKDFLARITPPCRDVTRLVSESMDRSLPLPIRIQLQLHYWICQACTEYRRQLVAIRQATRRSVSETDRPEDAQLSSAAKDRLKEALRARRD